MGVAPYLAGMYGGIFGGALTGGLDGGWQGALMGAAMGGAMGALGGWTAGGEHYWAMAGMFAAGAGASAATDSWDSFSGGLTGTAAGALIGGGIVNANKDEFSNYRAGYGFRKGSACSLEKAFAAKQYALTADYSEHIGQVETYYRNLDGNDLITNGLGRVHSFMRDTWSGEFHELDTVKVGGGLYSTFRHGIDLAMSDATQRYLNTLPLPDRTDYVNMDKFYSAMSHFESIKTYAPYSINIFTHADDCQGFRNYSIDNSKIYGKYN